MTKASSEVPEPAWFKSSYSGGNETECVEAAFVESGTAVRDSTRPHQGRFHVHFAAWASFVGSLRTGQLS